MSLLDRPLSRRQMLQASAVLGVGLVIGVAMTRAGRTFAQGAASTFAPNAFVRVAPDNIVTIIIKQHEMGQGVTTGLATLVADEMDADWAQIRYEYASANDKLYKNMLLLGFQVTGGSTSIADSFEQMRKAGAMARAMLVAAAAKQWGVAHSAIKVDKGVLRSGKHHATFGEMALAAAEMAPPVDVPLKTPERFTLIGKAAPRLDSPGKSRGTETYTIDVKLPSLLTAVVAHPPRFGAKLKSFDASKALAVPGVKKIVAIPQGVAVIASGMWPALKARDALEISWDESGAEKRSSSELIAECKSLLDKPGAVAFSTGDAKKAIAEGVTVLDAVYEFPYLAHAAMEPMNCVVWLRDGKLDTWSGHQAPTQDQLAAATAAGIAPEQVTVHSLPSGGSFGRRALPDYIIEAATIAKVAALGVPIRLQWTREDDMRAGYYRPLYVHSLKAALDDKGNISGWSHRIVGQSIMGSDPNFAAAVVNGVDGTTVEGAAALPYAMPNAFVDMHTTTLSVPVWWWRSVGHSHTTYAVETMIDQLASAAKRDTLEFRLALLSGKPRHANVLKMAAEKADWGKRLPQGMARGIALSDAFNSFIAQVVELHIEEDGSVKLDRVVVVIDCGQVVNPDIVRAQMEGGVGFGLSAALYSELTLDKGVVGETNFHGYKVLRFNDMPKVEVHIVDSKEKPTGVGEIGVGPIAPAVANAIAALTGQRIRTLPIARTQIRRA